VIGVPGIADVMDEIGRKLSVIPNLNVYPFNASDIAPPAAIVTLPGDITYGTTYGGSSYSAKTLIHVVVGRMDEESSRDNLSQYLDTTGPYSVYERVGSSNENRYSTCHDVTVVAADIAPLDVAGADYLDAVFEVEFIGKGLTS
jgi:hypothetical protein